MPLLLSRFARTLAVHWKRSLAGAVAVLVLLILAAAGAGDATDDYAIPGTESQEAVDLFKAHSPAFGGVDSTLVFTVDEGKVTDPASKTAIEAGRKQSRSSGSRSAHTLICFYADCTPFCRSASSN